MSTKNIIDSIEVDETILTPKPEKRFETEEPSLLEIEQDNKEQQQRYKDTPRHLKRKSLVIEKQEWIEYILTAPTDLIALRVGSQKAANIKRTRLYHARTVLVFERAIQCLEANDPLNSWSLAVELKGTCYYVVATRMNTDTAWLSAEEFNDL